jgi:phosphatidate cytidylyltransferase
MALTGYTLNGQYTFVLVFVAAWMCDSFAYFTGKFFGKHKLAPNLSPKKTVEGSIGGIVFAILGCMLYGLVVEKATGLNARYHVLAATGLILSIVSQIGDLWASLIKREYGVKDYSQMMPGHGGVMDRFDSIIAISTILMAICIAFPPFV